jgi:hypothetical protein
MTDDRVPRQKKQELDRAGKAKKQYQKPAFRYERVFETIALACGKIAPTSGACHHKKVS